MWPWQTCRRLSDKRHRFSVVLKSLRWVPNHENNRSFLVLQTRKPPGDELNDLLRASNKVARSFGQPCLYIPEEAPTSGKVVRKRDEQGSSSQIKPTRQMHARLCDYGKQSEVHEDASNHFHISIGWMLESPLKTSPNTAHSIECEQELYKLQLAVQTVKVKVGNGIVVIPLAKTLVESNGIIGI